MKTEFDRFAARGKGVFPPSQAKIAEPIVRAILAGKLSIGTEIDLQDEIYARTHSLDLAGMAKGMWGHFVENTALHNWGMDVLKEEKEN